jgi:cell wall-associated NlpC family hydrolase
MMTNQHSSIKYCGYTVFIPFCLLALSACNSVPRTVDSSPSPVAVVNDTRESATDTVKPASPPVSDVYSDKVIPLPPETPSVLGEEAALRAIAMVGKPYRYGGADLNGFDCSGLVLYVYHELGIDLPHSAAEQHRFTTRVSRDELLPGDLIFFRINHKRISHVGIYVGDNRFVHAPQSGKNIVIRSLDEEYYRKHWVGAGRVK